MYVRFNGVWPREKRNAVLTVIGIKQQVVKYASAHPYVATAVGAGATIACAPAVVTAPFLAVAGFGAGGIGASKSHSSFFFCPLDS